MFKWISLLRSTPIKLQNGSIIPSPSCFWLPGRRFSLLPRHSRTIHLQGLQHLPNYHPSQGVHMSVLQPKLCEVCEKLSNILEIRGYSFQSKDYGSDDDLAVMSDGEIDFDDGIHLSKDQLDRLRVNLYPESNNQVVRQLTQAESVQDVFTIVERHGNYLTAEQSSQAIVTLWDLHKVYERYGIDFPSFRNVKLRDFLNNVVNHQTFARLLSHLEIVSEDLECDAISCLLLYLYRFGIKDSSPVMQKLLLLSLEKLDNFSLSALSRLTVYLRKHGLKAYYIQSKVVSLLERKLEMVSTPHDLKLVTICLNNTSKLLSVSLFKKYEVMLQKFLRERKFDEGEPKVLLKSLRFLNQKDWTKSPIALQRDVMLYMSEKIHTLGGQEIISLNHYLQNILEPREILYKIQERARNLIEVSKSPSKKVKLMFCITPFSSFKNRSRFEELVIEQLDGENFPEQISVIFKFLRSIKTNNYKLCNAFWHKAFNVVENEIQKIEQPFLGMEEIMRRKVYKNYMYFNNNLGGTYRNTLLESKMSEILVDDLRGQTGMIPHKVARMASFIIGYSSGHGIPEDIFDKVILTGPQWSVMDIIRLSRGLQLSLTFNYTNSQRMYTKQITSICHALNSCTETHLKKVQSLGEVCSLTQAFLNRGGSSRTFLYDALVEKHIPFIGELSSRRIKDISMNFRRTKYLSSEILENMAQYVIDNQRYLTANTVERFLTCIYKLGYHPKHSDEFFSACINIFEQDRSSLSGLNCLEINVALCFYGYLNADTIQSVFNISFLDQLDEEVAACYSKGSYPHRIRHSLMELNRAVCIDHPEEKIPWFHEKYCKERLETVAVPNNAFSSEVHQALSQVIGGSEVVRANAKTPYFYLLDFEFLLDGGNQPVPLSKYASVSQTTASAKHKRIENNPGYRRIAVLLRNNYSYCVNSSQLMGRHQMECRHLEIIGYQVVEIPRFMWYSMAHATSEDRLQYLRTLIY